MILASVDVLSEKPPLQRRWRKWWEHVTETPENIYKVKVVGDSIECVKYESHFERNLGNPSVLEISDIVDFLSTEKAKAELIQPLTMEEYFARERR